MARFNELGDIPSDLQFDFYRTYAETLSNLGRYGEAKRYLWLVAALAERRNKKEGRPSTEGIPLFELSNINESLGDLDRAVAYALWRMTVDQIDDPERDDAYLSNMGPSNIGRLIDLLRRMGRDKEAAELDTFFLHEAKRDIGLARATEPLKFPIDLRVFERTFGKVERSMTVAGALGQVGQAYMLSGRYEEALPLIEQLARTSVNVYGVGHPNSSGALTLLSNVNRLSGRLRQRTAYSA